MRFDQLEHLIRAAGDVLREETIIVVGSQATLIDGVLGSGSMFDDTHGIHADGVSWNTAVLPAGWRERLIEIRTENTKGFEVSA